MLVSFIVPVYNAETTIQSCVASLKEQTFSNIEILLVNNCSTDSSLQKCNELAMADNRIRVIDFPEKGVSVARNRGIELAIGEFVAFVDADDWIDENVCEKFACLNAKYNYDLFCYSAQYHNRKSSIVSFLFGDVIELFTQKQKEELQIKVFAPRAPIFSYKMNTRFAGSACGKFYKREILLKNNLRFAVETIISEDVLFNTLALDYFYRIGYTKDCFYHYEQREGSAQNRFRPESDRYFSFVIDKIKEWLQRTEKDSRFMDAANCLFVHYLFGVLKEDLFHKDNQLGESRRKKIFNQLIGETPFSNALQNVNWKYFGFSERLFILLLMSRKYALVRTAMDAYNRISSLYA